MNLKIILLGAGFLLTSNDNTQAPNNKSFASPESDYELSLLPLNDFERSQVITVGNPEPLAPEPQFVTTIAPAITVISTQQIEIDNDSYILITYSNGSTQIMPIDQFNDITEIHVSVEDSDNNHHDHKTHSHHNNNENGHKMILTKNMAIDYQTIKISDDDNPTQTTNHPT